MTQEFSFFSVINENYLRHINVRDNRLLIRYNNIKEYRDLIYLADEELEKENFKARLGGYIKNLEVKDSVGYRIGIYGLLYHKENYHKLTEEPAQERCDYMAYETNNYEIYYYSLEEVEPFYVGICITNDNGDILYRGVSDVNNRAALGNIHVEEGEVYETHEDKSSYCNFLCYNVVILKERFV